MGKPIKDDISYGLGHSLGMQKLEIVKARIIIADIGNIPEKFLEEIEYDSRNLPADSEYASTYYFCAPLEFVTRYGRGILFENDWCIDGSISNAQTYNERTEEWEN